MSISEIRFLVDVGVGRKVEEYLEGQGFDSKFVRSINPRLSDQEIIKMATAENRMIITMDKDFGELVYHSSKYHCGVILLRLEVTVQLDGSNGIVKMIRFVIQQIFPVYPVDPV